MPWVSPDYGRDTEKGAHSITNTTSENHRRGPERARPSACTALQPRL